MKTLETPGIWRSRTFLEAIGCEASSSLIDGNFEMAVASMIERTGARIEIVHGGRFNKRETGA